MAIPAALRREVAQRAKSRCEYCGLSHLGQAATFHIDHIVPIVAGGETKAANLAFACIRCSLRKGARQSVLDPVSLHVVPLFHPRNQNWNHHFRWAGFLLVGITDIGRATIEGLALNSPQHQSIRSFEAQLGLHPPSGHV